MPTVEIKDYNVIIDGQQPFYEIPIKNKEETYKTISRKVIFWIMNILSPIIN